MKRVRYFWAEGGELHPLDENHKLIQDIKWHKDETLKLEWWPNDLKVGPCTQIPYGKPKQNKKDWVREILRNTAEYRRAKKARPHQAALIRVDQARTPYTEEFTKHDVARNRFNVSKKIPERRQTGQKPPPQTDAPF